MPIITIKKGGIGVLRVSGNMMSVREPANLHKKVKKLIDAGIPWIIIDMGQVAWLNSKGIGALVSSLTSCRNAGGELVVTRATRKIKSLLQITQIIKLIDTYDNIREAKKVLKTRMTDANG